MNQPLIDPLSNRVAVASTEADKEVAAIRDNRGCPVCNTEMKQILSMGVNSLMCETHRIILPELSE